MSEFDYDGPMGEVSANQKCKPDYEGLIKKEGEKKRLLYILYKSLKDIVFTQNINFGVDIRKLKDLMGTVHVKMVESDNNTQALLKAQEESE